jgi:hypothetical protein
MNLPAKKHETMENRPEALPAKKHETMENRLKAPRYRHRPPK